MRHVLTILLVAYIAGPVFAESWTQFRGLDGGRLSQVDHPLDWSANENLAWAVPMQGSGWSAPLALDDRIVLTAAVSDTASRPKGMAGGVASMRSFRSAKPGNHQFVVVCLSLADGKEMWRKVVAEKTPPALHPSNTYATESPVTNGEKIVTFFATTGTLTGWDRDGTELWQRELGTFPAGNGFGTGSSLAIWKDKVFVQFDNDENSFVAGFDISTGEQVWRDERTTRTSWSTPIVWQNEKRTELVTCGRGVVTSYDPADGKILWKLNGMQSGFSGSPAFDRSRIYFGNSGPSSRGPLVAVAAGLSGEIELDNDFESDQVAWSRTRSGPGMASPVVSGNRLFIPGSDGLLNCYNTETGERLYRVRVPNMKTVVASLWADAERVFILDENGTTHVIKVGDEFELLGTNELEDLIWSTPTVSDSTLLIRGVERLYCIRK